FGPPSDRTGGLIHEYREPPPEARQGIHGALQAMPVFFAGELRWSPVRRLLGAECLSREATGGGDERGACSAAGQGQRGRFARAARSAGELAAAHLQARGWLRARGSG